MKILSLFWHSVESDSIDAEYFDGSNPTKSVFSDQVKYIIDKFTPISIHEFIDILNDNKSLKSYSKPPVLLGFDDGFSNVLKHALPVLQEFHAPAIFFVIGEILINSDYIPWYVEIEHMLRKTAKTIIECNNQLVNMSSRSDRSSLKEYLISSYKKLTTEEDRHLFMADLAQLVNLERPNGSALDEDLRFVSKDDLISLKRDPFLTVSSHAMTHRLLANLTYDEQLYELKQSDLLLRQHCSSYYPAISYPNGSFNDTSIKIAKSLYNIAFAVQLGASYRNIYAYPRIGIQNDDIQELEYTVSSIRRNIIMPMKRFIRCY